MSNFGVDATAQYQEASLDLGSLLGVVHIAGDPLGESTGSQFRDMYLHAAAIASAQSSHRGTGIPDRGRPGCLRRNGDSRPEREPSAAMNFCFLLQYLDVVRRGRVETPNCAVSKRGVVLFNAL